jgi:hypothetical protein
MAGLIVFQLSAVRAFETNARSCPTQKQGLRADFTRIQQNLTGRSHRRECDLSAPFRFQRSIFTIY